MELNKLVGVITTILVVAIVLAVGLVITQEFRETNIASTSETVTNATNVTVRSLANTGIRVSTFTLSNSTETAGSGNYTLDAAAGTVILTDAGSALYEAQDLTAAYDHGEDLAAYTATNSSINALADIPTWIPLIVIVVIAAILLGLVFSVFGKKGETL